MYALTIHQPWAWAIAEGLKTIENRSWKAERIIGGRIAIHAAVKPMAVEDMEFVLNTAGLSRLTVDVDAIKASMGRVVATAVVETFIVQHRKRFTPRAPTELEAPWFVGPIGWVLRDVERIPNSPVVRGQQGLWVLPKKALGEAMPGMYR